MTRIIIGFLIGLWLQPLVTVHGYNPFPTNPKDVQQFINKTAEQFKEPGNSVPNNSSGSSETYTATNAAKQQTLILYTAPWCPYCKAEKETISDIRAELVRRGIRVEYRNSNGMDLSIPKLVFKGRSHTGYMGRSELLHFLQ